MKVKTSELTGAALDWAVGIAEQPDGAKLLWRLMQTGRWHPSTEWAQGGPIIDREDIALMGQSGLWPEPQLAAHPKDGAVFWGPTKLIAAMRCLVASKLGDEVDVPEELL